MSEPPPTQPVMIEARGLTKYYGDFAAVVDVSFSIPQGQVVAFLGPNGAGKSTTMKLLTGYLAPSTGIARIAGFDMATDRLKGAERLGYLPENGPLYNDMDPHRFDGLQVDPRRGEQTGHLSRGFGRPHRHHGTPHLNGPPSSITFSPTL